MKKIFNSLLHKFNITTSKVITFALETGDEVKVEFNTTDGYNIIKNVPFEITLNNETQTVGTFITKDMVAEYVKLIASGDPNAEFIETDVKDGTEYTFWSYDNEEYKEYNIVANIRDSNIGILLGNPISEESARECFNRLSFSC